MDNNIIRWTTQTNGTVDVPVALHAAVSVIVRLFLGRFLPSLGAVLHEEANALHFVEEFPSAVAGALSRHLIAVSSKELEGGRTGPQAGAGLTGGQGGCFLTGGAALQSRVVHRVHESSR